MKASGPRRRILHNGSIPNLYLVLSPKEERDKQARTFCVGHDLTYDSINVGFTLTDQCPQPFKFDTTLHNNGNKGHEFRKDSGCEKREGQPGENGVLGVRTLRPGTQRPCGVFEDVVMDAVLPFSAADSSSHLISCLSPSQQSHPEPPRGNATFESRIRNSPRNENRLHGFSRLTTRHGVLPILIFIFLSGINEDADGCCSNKYTDYCRLLD